MRRSWQWCRWWPGSPCGVCRCEPDRSLLWGSSCCHCSLQEKFYKSKIHTGKSISFSVTKCATKKQDVPSLHWASEWSQKKQLERRSSQITVSSSLQSLLLSQPQMESSQKGALIVIIISFIFNSDSHYYWHCSLAWQWNDYWLIITF